MTARGRATLFYILPALALALTLSAWSLSAYRQQREQKRMAQNEQLKQIRDLLERCRDMLDRHPDVELERERFYLTQFTAAARGEQLERQAELRSAAGDLERQLIFLSTGVTPDDEQWQRVCRYKTFSPNGFKKLLDSLIMPDTEPIRTPPSITGEQEADARIIELALSRGYRLRQQADVSLLVSEGRHSLQSPALAAWRGLQDAARAEGVQLELVSAYRSVERQRQIFRSELAETAARMLADISPAAIKAGGADPVIDEVLRSSSIPGFSRHHGGYVIDIGDPSQGGDFTEFAGSRGFAWLSEHNYLNAKRFGFIPSYPDGADNQGPEPEPWELAWVGGELLETDP